MARTADRFSVNGALPPRYRRRSNGEHKAMLRYVDVLSQLVRQNPVIVADNVHAALSHKPMVVEDLPCLMPPWPFFWIEYPSASGKERRACIVTDATELVDLGDEHDFIVTPGINEPIPVYRPPGTKGDAAHLVHGAIENAGDRASDVVKVLQVTLFIEAGRQILGPAAILVLALDDRGQAIGNRWEQRFEIPKEDPLDAEAWIMAASATALQTISLLHCRNVETEIVHPEKKMSRAHQRRFGEPLLRYRRVKVVVGEKRKRSDHVGEPGGELPWHIVPGHFAHYGDCCPPRDGCPIEHTDAKCFRCGGHLPHGLLFGRRQGMYWIESHAAGNPERGEVHTDYDVAMKVDVA